MDGLGSVHVEGNDVDLRASETLGIVKGLRRFEAEVRSCEDEGAICNLHFFAQQRALGALLLHCEHRGVWACFALGALGGGESED